MTTDDERVEEDGRPAEPDFLLGQLSRSPDLTPFEALVRPLLSYDRERHGDLVRTLKVYFDAGANASEAADRLFLHRNSLLYRLERIQKLVGLDLKEPGARLALQLGLLAVERGESDATEHP